MNGDEPAWLRRRRQRRRVGPASWIDLRGWFGACICGAGNAGLGGIGVSVAYVLLVHKILKKKIL